MRQWLIGAAAASILSAGALALCPQGRVKNVLRFACGLLCALSLAAPVLTLDITELAASMAAYGQAARSAAENGEEERKRMERAYIEEQCAAYISDRAAALGTPAGSVSVLARWDGEALVWFPWSAELDADYAPALSAAIEAELGVPPQRQKWRGE